MLLVVGGWAYAHVGGCKVENPRWLRRVLRTVGLIGEGEMDVRGRGDLRVAGAAVGTASMSLGLAARASIVAAGSGYDDNDINLGRCMAAC